MNKYQKTYLIALAQRAYAVETYKQIEKECIEANNIKNSDGSTPTCLFDIEDYDTFNTAFASVEDDLNALRVPQHEARLKKAEDRLIAYALSCMLPEHAEQREKLREMTKDYCNLKERKALLDYALSLDPVLV